MRSTTATFRLLPKSSSGIPRRGVFYRPVKRHITARVDADVLDWVEAEGKGYQTLINAIFRRKCSTPQSRTGK